MQVTVLGVAKGWARLSDFDLPCSSDGKESACNAGDLGSIPGSGKSLGEENAFPSFLPSTPVFLAWRTPWIEKPGRLQSIGSQKVGHDQVT